MSGWIACSERMPEEGVPVLIRRWNGTVVAACLQPHPYHGASQYWDDQQCGYLIMAASHWRPRESDPMDPAQR